MEVCQDDTYIQTAYIHTYIHCKMSIIRLGSPAYLVLGLDVGSSMAEQVGDLGVTIIGGSDQGSEPTLEREGHTAHYEIRSGHVILH